MKTLYTTLLAALALLASAAYALADAQTQSVSPGALGVSLDEVFAAWDARAENLRAFEAVWDQQEWIRRGSLHTTALSSAGTPSLAPEKDTTLSSVLELRVGDERAYTSRSGMQWDTELNVFADRTLELLLEPARFTLLSRVGQHRVEPRATILPVDRYRDSRGVPNMPLFLAVRARDKSLAPVDHDGAWSVSPVTARAGDKTCIVLERVISTYNPNLAHGELRETYWVDPAQDFCIRRFERAQGGLVELQLEMAYENSDHPWLPTTWKSVVYGGTEALPMRQYEGQLKSFAVNSPDTAERLSLELPAGAAVQDIVLGEAWIALASGGRRVVTAEERARGATYAQLLASEPGQAGLSAWRPWRTLASTAALCLAVALVISRWRQRHTGGEVVASSNARTSTGWLAMLALGASLTLTAFAANNGHAAPTLCATRCHNGVWSAYRQGFIYRIDFIFDCKFRAWSTDFTVPYAPTAGCTAGFVNVPYYLVYSTIPHACNGYAQTGDLMYTMRANGTTVDVFQFQCCNPEGTCYGTKQ